MFFCESFATDTAFRFHPYTVINHSISNVVTIIIYLRLAKNILPILTIIIQAIIAQTKYLATVNQY